MMVLFCGIYEAGIISDLILFRSDAAAQFHARQGQRRRRATRSLEIVAPDDTIDRFVDDKFSMNQSDSLNRLALFVREHPRLFVLTGAGVSTESGIPGYRDENGTWRGGQPIQGPAFIRDEQTRKRYWARSLIGWPHFSRAEPNAAHRALAGLEELGHVCHLVTQNVDGLHQRAGSRRVTDLHGRLDRVVCLACRKIVSRSELQCRLEARNQEFAHLEAERAADGDALLESVDFLRLELVDCDECGGILKPDVIFFGETVPVDRVRFSMERLRLSDAVLVVGSSLMVYSGFRFCREAKRLGIAIGAVNLGRTRADEMLDLKVTETCTAALPRLLDEL